MCYEAVSAELTEDLGTDGIYTVLLENCENDSDTRKETISLVHDEAAEALKSLFGGHWEWVNPVPGSDNLLSLEVTR